MIEGMGGIAAGWLQLASSKATLSLTNERKTTGIAFRSGKGR